MSDENRLSSEPSFISSGSSEEGAVASGGEAPEPDHSPQQEEDSLRSVWLEEGTLVRRGDERFVVGRPLSTTAVLGRSLSTGRLKKLDVSDLRATREGSPSSATDVTALPDEDWTATLRRFEDIEPLIGTGTAERTRSDVEARAQELGVSVRTLYRRIRRYEEEGRVTALSPKPRSDQGKGRLDEEVEEIIHSCIDEVYLTPQKRTAQSVCDEVRRRCRKADLDAPHDNTVRRRIKERSRWETLRKRRGAKEARETLGAAPGRFESEYPLAVVQVDHTKLDLFVVGEETREPVGRPWITLAFDVFSRMVCGFYVSLADPSAMSVGLCLSQAILPKESFLASRDVDAEWPVWGFPDALHLDNAREFRGRMLQRACIEHGIDLEFRPVARPSFGGHVERMMGTLAGKIHELPGTTFSSPVDRGNYDSEGRAALTLEELETWLTIHFTKVYHQREHSSLGMSPLEKWKEGILGGPDKKARGLPERPTGERRLQLDFMPFERRTVQRYGIVIDGIHYWSDVLRPWVAATDPAPDSGRKRKFICKRDPRDISQIWFFDPELEEYFPVPYRNTARPPISVWELRAARKKAKEERAGCIDEQAIFDAHERLSRIQRRAKKATRKTRRLQNTAGRASRLHSKLSDEPDSRGGAPDEAPSGNETSSESETDADDPLSGLEPFDYDDAF